VISILKRDFTIQFFSMIGFCLGSFGFAWLYISIFPQLHHYSTNIKSLMDSLPKGLSQAFGINASFFDNEQSYLSGEMFSLIWPIFAIMLVISRTGQLLSLEKEKGTISFLLSQPISRATVFLSKFAVGALSLAIFVIASIIACIPLSSAYKVNFSISHFLSLALIGFLFGLTILSLTFCLAAISNSREKLYIWMSTIIALMYALFVLSGSLSSFDWCKYGSFFYYLGASKTLSTGALDHLSIVVFGVCSATFLFLGVYIFNKKDLYV